MSLQHPHPHTGPGDTWLMAIRDEPGRGWKAQSDLISSPRLYAVLPIKSSGLMPPLFSSPPTRRSLLKPQLSGNGRGEGVTHTGAADEDHAEGLYDAGDAHHPCEPQEEDHPKDVLQAGQVHPHEGAHAGCLWSRRGGGRWSIRGAPHCLAVPHLQGIQPENRLEKDIPNGDLGIQRAS